jgi:protein-arginine kinase activator protein McsA
LISNIDRNSQQSGQRAVIGALGSRQMVWTKTPHMEAWTCFVCGWAFIPSGPPRGNSLEEMMSNYELQRDKEYASHVCTECPKLQNTLATSKFPAHQKLALSARAMSASMNAKA